MYAADRGGLRRDIWLNAIWPVSLFGGSSGEGSGTSGVPQLGDWEKPALGSWVASFAYGRSTGEPLVRQLHIDRDARLALGPGRLMRGTVTVFGMRMMWVPAGAWRERGAADFTVEAVNQVDFLELPLGRAGLLWADTAGNAAWLVLKTADARAALASAA